MFAPCFVGTGVLDCPLHIEYYCKFYFCKFYFIYRIFIFTNPWAFRTVEDACPYKVCANITQQNTKPDV